MVRRLEKQLQSHLSGQATFVEDLNVRDQLYVAFLRSPVAHARIREIDTGRTRKVGGLLHVFTGPDLQDLVSPDVWREFPLAVSEVVYQGQPVAAIVASKRQQLEDCLDEISVRYEAMPEVLDPTRALEGNDRWLSTAPSNIVFEQESRAGRPSQVLKRSPRTLKLRFQIPRLSPYPLEGRGIVIERGRSETIVYSSTQSPSQLQQFLAESTTGSRPIRVIQTAVGGAFGAKIFPYAEDLASYLVSNRLRRNVKWVPLPEEKLVTLTNRPAETHEVQVGYDDSGRILAFRDRVLVDAGAYYAGTAGGPLARPGTKTLLGTTAIDQMVSMSTGPYDIRDVEVRVTAVATNKVMMGPIRGSGGAIATFILERTMNQIACRLGLDQFSVRKANLICDDSLVHKTALGVSIPQLRFTDLLEAARNSKATRAMLPSSSRGRGSKLRGLGVSFYLSESAPPSEETVRLELSKGGLLLLFVGVAPTGQGSERTLAAMISESLHVSEPSVEVRFGDTRTSHSGAGTQSSRSIAYAGSAALLACQQLVRRLGDRLGESSHGRSASVTFRAGLFHQRFKGGISRDLDFAGVARELRSVTAVDATYRSETSTFSTGCHISLVEVDSATGSVKVVRHLSFDDLGTVLDRSALTAQIEGGVMQSIGEALQERIGYDRRGRLIRSYFMPSATATPRFAHVLVRLTTSQHLHGARGAGEAGRVGSLPAIVNAVENALSAEGRTVFLPSIPIGEESIRKVLSE
jgi:carbon-monoxide dehydrogenase large subunit